MAVCDDDIVDRCEYVTTSSVHWTLDDSRLAVNLTDEGQFDVCYDVHLFVP